MPQTPTMQVSAGARDFPIPESAPEKTSRKTLMARSPTTMYMRMDAISMISVLDVKMLSMGRAKMQQSALNTMVEEQPSRSVQRTVRRQRSIFFAPKFCPTKVTHACEKELSQ